MDDTLRRLNDWNLSWSPKSPAYEANQHFMNSLRKYPDPAKYSNLMERLIRNMQNKHINKIKNASKTSSKRTQTFNKTNISIENILSVYDKMFFVNKYNESYDYLNASRDQRSTWQVPSLEARYLYDLKKYIKRKLRQICDESLPLECNDIRNPYEQHRRQHHQHRVSSTEPPNKSQSQCTSCYICYQPKPCSCINERTTPTRNSYEDRFQKEIAEWTSKLPIYLDDSIHNNQKRKDMVDELVTNIQKLKNDVDVTEFNTKVRFIVEDFLNEYPMWSPQDLKKRKEFINYLVDELVHKLNEERKFSKDICGSEEDILKMLNNITANESKEEIIKEVLKRLKPLAQENAKDNTKYKEQIKTSAIEVLKKISEDKNIDSKDVIKDLAVKLSDYLTSIRQQESQSSQTDKEDSNIVIRSEHEREPKFTSSRSDHSGSHDNNIKGQISNMKSKQTVNQPFEAHASKSLLRSFSRMLPADDMDLDDTANITEAKQVPSRKTSLKYSRKRWIKKERSKHKTRKDSKYPIELSDTIEDQVVRANNNENIENASQVVDESEMIKTVHYPKDRTMSAMKDSIEHNPSNKSTIDVFAKTSSETKNEPTLDPNKQKILEAVQEWIDNLPVNLNETKETLTTSLTSDIQLRQKFKDLKLDHENDDVGFLKFKLFKNLCHVLSYGNLAKVILEVDKLMQTLDDLHITKASDAVNENKERPSHSQIRRKSLTTHGNNNKTNEGAYLSEDDEQNDFISSNINNVVDKNSSKQSKDLNNDDYDLLQKIRERSMLFTEQSHLDDISKEIAMKTNISKLNGQENNTGNEIKSSVTQTKDTVERSSQIDKDFETTIPSKNSEYFNDTRQIDVAHKGEKNKSREINKCILAENIGCDDELYQSETMDSFPYCIFCRTKYAAEARRRCKRLKRKRSMENVDDDYHTFCPECGLNCSYPSRMYFC